MNSQKACQHRPKSELKYNTINFKTYDVHSLTNTPNAGKSVKALGPTHTLQLHSQLQFRRLTNTNQKLPDQFPPPYDQLCKTSTNL